MIADLILLTVAIILNALAMLFSAAMGLREGQERRREARSSLHFAGIIWCLSLTLFVVVTS